MKNLAFLLLTLSNLLAKAQCSYTTDMPASDIVCGISANLSEEPANIWTQKASFGGIARYYIVSLSISSKDYIGVRGTSGTYKKDFCGIRPRSQYLDSKINFNGSLISK